MHRQRDVQRTQGAQCQRARPRERRGQWEGEAPLARDVAEQIEELAVREVAVGSPEDVAAAALTRALDEQEALGDVPHVDVVEAAGGRDAQRATKVLLGDERRDAVDVARADRERRIRDDDVLARRGRPHRDLLAGTLVAAYGYWRARSGKGESSSSG